jgi:hypothetical protein
LFNLAIDSKLRGCDLVGLRVHDVVQGRGVVPRAMVMQKQSVDCRASPRHGQEKGL